MSDVATLLRSFAAGEITPELHGRVDLTRFQTGLKRCRNFITLPWGPAQNRCGFEYRTEARFADTPVRLIPFVFNASQAYVIELGFGYARFHTPDGVLLEPPKAITSIFPDVFNCPAHGFSNGDHVFITGAGYTGARFANRQVRVTVIDADSFLVSEQDGSASIGVLGTFAVPGSVARVYTINTPYAAADLFRITYVQSNDVLTLTCQGYAPSELRRLGPVSWQLLPISFAPAISPPGTIGAVVGAGPGTGTTYFYAVTAVLPSGEESYISAQATVVNNLNSAGAYNTVSWTAVTGALRYNVYKGRNALWGFIGETPALSFNDDNILADLTRAPPEPNDPFAVDTPAAVTYYEQRRVFAGTAPRPQTAWFTKPGTERNLSYSLPTRDDDAFSPTIAARQQNLIRHLVPLNDLLILTSGVVYRLRTLNSDALTPTTASFKPLNYVGANQVQPVTTDDACLFASDKGGRLREVRSASGETGSAFAVGDASLMAPHLVDGYSLVDLAFQRATAPILWAVRSDGTLLGMTYVPEQDVRGWHQHATAAGAFESVAAIPDGEGDTLFAVVRRTVPAGGGGFTERRYIEKLRRRDLSPPRDGFFVDFGASYSGAPTSTVSGLWHLEGQEVAILADGAEVAPQTVVNGRVTLEAPASIVHIGLPIDAYIETLPIVLEGAPAAGQGAQKSVARVMLRVVDSSAIFVGTSVENVREYRQRLVSETLGAAPNLRTGWIDVVVDGAWNPDGGVVVRTTKPLPLTVAALALETAVGG